jgi:DHA2 family multidrug resistance protein
MGTSVIVAILVRSSQINYIEMRNHINVFTEGLDGLGTASGWNLDSISGIAALQKLVLAQAEMMAYLNAFVFLVGVAFIAMPLIFFLRTPTKAKSS